MDVGIFKINVYNKTFFSKCDQTIDVFLVWKGIVKNVEFFVSFTLAIAEGNAGAFYEFFQLNWANSVLDQI